MIIKPKQLMLNRCKQTDMSNQLDKLEQMLADELNLDKR